MHEIIDGDGSLIYRIEKAPSAIKTGVTSEGGVTGTEGAFSDTTSEVTADFTTATRTPKASEPVPGEIAYPLNDNVPQSMPTVNFEMSDVGEKGTPAADPRSIPAALNGSTGIDGAVEQDPTDSLTPGERYVNSLPPKKQLALRAAFLAR